MYLRGTWGTGKMPVAVDDAENDAIRSLILSNTNDTLSNDIIDIMITTIGVRVEMSYQVNAFVFPSQFMFDNIIYIDRTSCSYHAMLRHFNIVYAGHDYIVSSRVVGGRLNNLYKLWTNAVDAINIAIHYDQKGAVLHRQGEGIWRWRELSLNDLSGLNVKRIIRLHSNPECGSYIMEVVTSGRKCIPRQNRRYVHVGDLSQSRSKVKRIFAKKIAPSSDVYIFSMNPLITQQMQTMHLQMMESFVPQDMITVHVHPPADEDGLTYDGDDVDD
jgi:hypothetical protein